jgi:uncharacterized zinc-type alcohol dehydrogenase-like protein
LPGRLGLGQGRSLGLVVVAAEQVTVLSRTPGKGVLGFPRSAQVQIMDLTYGRKKLSSSGTGGRRGTAQLLAFCAERGITADVELLPSAEVDEALTRLDRGDVRYRFVLDLSDLG